MPDASCAACQQPLPPKALACQACHSLVHADTLRALAVLAQEQASAGVHLDAIHSWQECLELIPHGSRQRQTITARIDALQSQHKSAESAKASDWKKKAMGLSAIGLLAWKLKFVLVFIATKLKLLLLGLGKASTAFSMLLSFGVYWAAWGWKFAAGLVISIYIHEMGHVAALRRFGVPATAPMFIPGLGAVIRLKHPPKTTREDAITGLAGPIWGLAAALIAYVVFLGTDWPSWAAIARVGAWINLFNLLPFWQLDGGRGFNGMTRPQRWLATAGLAIAWLVTQEGLLILLALVAFSRCFSTKVPDEPDPKIVVSYLSLVALLSVMCLIEVPGF